MNHLIRKVLKEVILCLFITKPNRIKREGSKRKGRGTTVPYQVLRRDRLFRLHEKMTTKKERRETENIAEK